MKLISFYRKPISLYLMVMFTILVCFCGNQAPADPVTGKNSPATLEQGKNEDSNFFEEGGKNDSTVKKSKRFPWLLVAGGVVVAAGLILLLTKKKDNTNTPPSPPLSNDFKITDFTYTVSQGYKVYNLNGMVYANYLNNTNSEVIVNGWLFWGDGKSSHFTGMSIPSGPAATGQWKSWNIWHEYTNVGTYSVDITVEAFFKNGKITSTFKKSVVISK